MWKPGTEHKRIKHPYTKNESPLYQMKRILFTTCLLLAAFAMAELQAQTQRETPVSQMFRMAEGIVRIAEPGQLADTLNIWGDVSLPGRYVVPRGTNVADLMSYARGPLSLQTQETQIDWSRVRLEVAISRYNPETGLENVLNLRYSYNEPVPLALRHHKLQNNDIISIQVRRKPIFIDYIRAIAPTVSLILTSILLYDRIKGR